MEKSELVKRLADFGRNDKCHCGSGKKYKQCHMSADEEALLKIEKAEQAKRDEEAKKAAENAPVAESSEHTHSHSHASHVHDNVVKPKASKGAPVVQPIRLPRKVGGA